MKITIEPTSELVEVGPIICRVWSGCTEDGRTISAVIATVGSDDPEVIRACELELIALDGLPDRERGQA